MKELELKFLEIDKDALVFLLEKRGAIKTVDGILKTVYFDFPDGRILKNHELCRVRTFGDRVEFCTKTNMRIEDGCKVYDEIEVHVSDFDNICLLLKNLKMIEAMHFEKKRVEYALPAGTKFEIDEFPGVPVFLELEADSVDTVKRIAKEFDLEKYETSYLTGEEILKLKYGKALNGLMFQSH